MQWPDEKSRAYFNELHKAVKLIADDLGPSHDDDANPSDDNHDELFKTDVCAEEAHSCASEEADEDSDGKETDSDETDIDDQLTDSDYETYIQAATDYERDAESRATRRRMRENIANIVCEEGFAQFMSKRTSEQVWWSGSEDDESVVLDDEKEEEDVQDSAGSREWLSELIGLVIEDLEEKLGSKRACFSHRPDELDDLHEFKRRMQSLKHAEIMLPASEGGVAFHELHHQVDSVESAMDEMEELRCDNTEKITNVMSMYRECLLEAILFLPRRDPNRQKVKDICKRAAPYIAALDIWYDEQYDVPSSARFTDETFFDHDCAVAVATELRDAWHELISNDHLQKHNAELLSWVKDRLALDAIRREQQNTTAIIDRDSFALLCAEIVQDMSSSAIVFDDEATDALQVAAEDFLITLFQDQALLAIHSDRTHITAKDKHCVIRLNHISPRSLT
jgi:histone H3/H4